ncbi:MAG: hypothetical protein JJT89_02055 [Nitriliruptoraceae bacterium]|nr:hypothetical protein [Nitriliruptoraceae bacterium]
MSTPRLIRPGARTVLAAALATVLLAACVEPDLEPETEPTAEDEPLGAEVLDPTTDALITSIEELTDTVAQARAAFVEAADGDEQAAADGLDLLLRDPDDPADGPGLLPARTLERELAGRDVDQLSATVSLARDAGGTLGRATVETLRESVAGDLGAWERDAEGVVATAQAAGRGITDVEAATADILTLPGDGTRALAWATLAVEGSDAQVRAAAAERAAGHLGVVLLALEALLDPDGPDDATDDTDDQDADDPDVPDPDDATEEDG